MESSAELQHPSSAPAMKSKTYPNVTSRSGSNMQIRPPKPKLQQQESTATSSKIQHLDLGTDGQNPTRTAMCISISSWVRLNQPATTCVQYHHSKPGSILITGRSVRSAACPSQFPDQASMENRVDRQAAQIPPSSVDGNNPPSISFS
ncbi:hypothetical protein ACLOJK_019535 [Asimina triloba]